MTSTLGSMILLHLKLKVGREDKMSKIVYTDRNKNKYFLDLTKRGIGKNLRPTAQEVADFYEKYIKQHDPAASD